MKKRKVLTGALALTMLGGVALTSGCSVSDKDGKAWAEENGYVKAEDYNIVVGGDADTSATASGVGGINFGDVAWTDALIKEALKEYLKGHEYDDGTYNYREMYQIATSVNNVPQISSVEYYMNPETFNFFGFSENNTGKLNDMVNNENVAMYWTRQLRETDKTSVPDYYKSYGVEIQGKVVIHSVEEVATMTDAEITALAKDVRAYYKSLNSMPQYWDTTYNKNGVTYISNDKTLLETAFASQMGKGYSIVPTKIVVTSPYMLYMVYNPTDDNFKIAGCAEEYKFLPKTFLKQLLNYVRTAKNDQTLNQITSMNMTTFTTTGLKTQATLTFEN